MFISEFFNENGAHIRITCVENDLGYINLKMYGPVSVSENIMTKLEAQKVIEALTNIA